MKRYFLEIAYNGSDFHGWQMQKQGIRTVQSTINDAFDKLFRTPIETTGCGRTDTGVHAKQFYIHFDAEKLPERFIYKLNGVLPKSIVAYSVKEVHEEAHTRFDAEARTYQYFVHQQKDPFNASLSYFVPKQLDLEAMNEAAKLLLGEQDFTSFSKLHSNTFTNICNVTHAEWKRLSDHRLVFEITANRFLRNMVRAIVGTLIMVGEGKITVKDFQEIINKKDRGEAGKSVDGHALFLVGVEYPYLKQD